MGNYFCIIFNSKTNPGGLGLWTTGGGRIHSSNTPAVLHTTGLNKSPWRNKKRIIIYDLPSSKVTILCFPKHLQPSSPCKTQYNKVGDRYVRWCLAVGSVYLWYYRRRTICSCEYRVEHHHHHHRQCGRETRPSTIAVATTVARWPAAFYSTARYASLRWSDHRNVHTTKIDPAETSRGGNIYC